MFGKVGNHQVVVFEGRVHYYEGYTMAEVTFCTRVIGRLGDEDSDPDECLGRDQSGFRRAGI